MNPRLRGSAVRDDPKLLSSARVAKLVDAVDSKSTGVKTVPVRVRPLVPSSPYSLNPEYFTDVQRVIRLGCNWNVIFSNLKVLPFNIALKRVSASVQ